MKEETPAQASATYDKVAKMLDSNVVGVAALYDSFDPWMWNESHERPCGIVIPGLYLMGSKYKGVFGDGTIRPRLYVREMNGKGETNWKVAKQWSLNVEEAIPYRSKRQTVIGWGYRLHLPWDELTQFSGKEVRMVVEFERKDGTKVASDKKDFRVPAANAS